MIKNLIKIFNRSELALIKRLNTPIKVQDFLDALPFNFEDQGETYYSPRKVIDKKTAHCFEGALFAALCFRYHKRKHFLIDLKVKKSAKKDSDHVVCVFESKGAWGAVSKTNHAVLRYRDPIFKNYSEIAKSYFHEYFLDTGEKTLESYSKPFDVWRKFGEEWVGSDHDLDHIALSLDKSPHTPFLDPKNKKFVRKAGKTEIKGGAVEEWKK